MRRFRDMSPRRARPGTYTVLSSVLKGTVARDFPLTFFFIKSTHLGPWCISSVFFKFGFKFLELLQLKFDSPLHTVAGSKISPLHHTAGSQISPLHFAAGSLIFPLHFAAERGDSLLHLASDLSAAKCSGKPNLTAVWYRGEPNHTAASCIGESNLIAAWCSGESSLKNIGRLPRPLKGQSCKK